MSDQDHKAAIEPTDEQLQALLALKAEGPFHFINLLRFREIADYPAEHPLAGAQVSGADAYNSYGAVALAQVTRRGGRLVTFNAVEQQLIGVSAGWHQIATMEYQTVAAFMDMVSDPDYQQALVHRDAGLEATQVIVTRPLIDAPIG